LLPVGRFFGVPIYFAPSWLIIAALLTVWYAPVISTSVTGGISGSGSYLLAFAFAVLFALCVLAHELGHTAVSLALGTPVRRIVIYLLGGVSEIEHDPKRPRDEILIAAAGPGVSAVLFGAFFAADLAVTAHTMADALLSLLWLSNAAVFVFNMLPALPLDGGRIVRAGVWAVSHNRLAGTRFAAWGGRLLAVAVAVIGLVVDRRAGWGFTAGLLSLAMAAYLWYGAGQSLRVGVMLERVPDLHLPALLRPGILVPADVSVAEALNRAWSGRARGLVVTDAWDRPQAIVDEVRIGAVPPDRRAWTRLSDVSRALEPGLVLPVTLSGEDLVAAVRATPAREYFVVNPDGSPAGILATSDLIAALGHGR
jgi:Zn-dependent protease